MALEATTASNFVPALIVVDDPTTGNSIVDAVREFGFSPTVVHRLANAESALLANPYSLVIGQWHCQSTAGADLCHFVREKSLQPQALLLLLAECDSPGEYAKIIEAGADDYFPVPLDAALLRVRLQVAARRVRLRISSLDRGEQLRKSVERFELAVSGANDGLWDALPSGDDWNRPDSPVWFSTRMKQMLGYRDEEFPNVLASWEQLLHPEDRVKTFAALQAHIEHRIPYDVEYRLRTKSGKYRWFSARGQALWDSEGRVMRMAGSLRDIDQTKELEVKLKKSDAEWRSLVDSAPNIIMVLELDGAIRFINRDTPVAKESIGKSAFDYVDPQHRETMHEAIKAVRTTGKLQTFEVHGQTEHGQGLLWYDNRVGPIIRDGVIESIILIATDITERKNAESQLQQSEAKFRSLVKNAPDIVILTSPEGQLEFINNDNPAGQQAIGRTAYDYVYEPFWERIKQGYEELRESGKPQQFEVQAHKAGGGTAWYSTRMGPVWDHDDKIKSVVVIATDITQRKHAEAQLLEERQTLKRLLEVQERERQLVAYDIHDGLVQYLTGGLMHLEAFADARPKNAKLKEEYDRGVKLLRDAVGEARRLISGLRPPILDEQGVVSALEYLVNEARPEIPEIQFVPKAFFGRLDAASEAAIFRITQEALSNIRRHSGSKRALVELRQHGNWVRLLIRDWGCGFDPAKVRDERFGLHGIRQRAKLLGTQAMIESKANQGTQILVDIPLLQQQPAEGLA